MTDELSPNEDENRTAARRKFLKLASQVAVTTPAVTMLLSAGTKKAVAGEYEDPLDGPELDEDLGPVDTDTDPGDRADSPPI